jgi:geranylgeranyl reductase family protein
MLPIYDAAIVGSGPAGCTAALRLAGAGMQVVLIEKEKLPRYKTCGGGIVYRARTLLPVDISAAVERSCYCARMTLLNSGLTFEVRRDKPLISMTMRASLDDLLVKAAQACGARLITGCQVLSLTHHSRYLHIETDNGPVKARFVIAADGANGTVARVAGWQETRLLIPAIECELFVDDNTMARFADAAARFDFDLPPHGYAWVFPKRDHLSLGVLSVKRGRGQLRQALAYYLKALSIPSPYKQEQHGFIIPISPRRDGFVRDRVLLVGDVAGFADPVTAEGISGAIKSGDLAAQALITSELDERKAEKIYERLLAKQILPELATARLLAKLLYGSPRLRSWVSHRYGVKLIEVVTDIFMGQKTYHSIVMNPLNYWKLLKYSLFRQKR